jgi:hypothetical protein
MMTIRFGGVGDAAKSDPARGRENKAAVRTGWCFIKREWIESVEFRRQGTFAANIDALVN